jgi:hypothetical protein
MEATQNVLQKYWTTRVSEDLEGFADPRTEVEVSRDGGSLRASWVMRGRTREERFQLSQEGDFRWIKDDATPTAYRDFLTDPGMADFGQLADAMTRVFRARPDFVATDAKTEDAVGNEVEIEASPPGIREQIIEARKSAEGRTGMFFIKGDAGSGKTTLLREMVADQAERYCKGNSKFLFFFVSAQGRTLSNLRDIFSSELQALRAAFTRDAIPALARSRLLVPVIDGFDEMLGAAGYGDAFSSLYELLTELQGDGAIVVSARSAFYNVEFVDRTPDFVNPAAGSSSAEASITLQPISLLPWTEDKLEAYLRLKRPDEDHGLDREVMAQLDKRDQELLTRPFFASEFPGYVAAKEGGAAVGGSLLGFLIDAYIRRETSKVLNASGDPLLSSEGHRKLLEEAAEFMWESEKRQLGVVELQTLVELVAEEEGLGGSDASQLVTKVTSSAGFRTQSPNSGRLFTFDHEVYFEYFLSQSLARRLSSPGDLGQFLDRGVLPDGVIEGGLEDFDDATAVEAAASTTSTALRHENRRRNSGAIVAAWTRRHGPLEGFDLAGLAFVDIDFGAGEYKEVTFENCEFTGSRFDRVTFEGCQAIGSRFQGIIVTNQSKMGLDGLVPGANFGSLIHPDVDREVFSPSDVRRILRELGAPMPGEPDLEVTYSKKADVLIRLLSMMMRAYRRSNVLFETDDYLGKLFDSTYWPELRAELTAHQIVREETRSSSGPAATVYRLLVSVDDLVNSENALELPPGPIGEFWSSMRGL